MGPNEIMAWVLAGVGAATVGVVTALLGMGLVRKMPAPIDISVIAGRTVKMDEGRVRCLVEDLLKTSHPEIHVVATGVDGPMAYRGEIWDSLAEIRSRYLGLSPEDDPILGVHKVPYWLTSAATAEDAWDACEEYLEDQVRSAMEAAR